MAYSERPGVYSSIDVSSSYSGSGSGGIAGVAAKADSGEVGKAVSLSSYAEARAKFGADSELTRLVKLLFMNGAQTVVAAAAAVDAEPTTAQYKTAFDALLNVPDIGVMLCASQSNEVHSALKDALETASETGKYRIGIIDAQGTPAELAAKASSLNCEKLVMAAPCVVDSEGNAVGGMAAAALAGAIVSSPDPALPVNGARIYGVDGLNAAFTDTEIDTLIRGGVTPLENLSGEIYVVRGVTTRTTTEGVADYTWREITTVLIVNNIIPTIRTSLKRMFSRSKNTRQTRGAIRTQVIVELEKKLSAEIIDGYSNVTVEASADDPTLCEVGFEFTVAHGLNRIELSAHITV